MTRDEEIKALTEQFQRLSRRVRMMNLLVVGTLVLALAGGTAWAASRYLITSTTQIKPSVLKQLTSRAANGRDGSPGAQGPRGVQGPAGPGGATGPVGSTGASGAVAG